MDFNAEPFWDDFEASNGAKEENYMRILFRPGYAVQARELTQIQSILQNQIKSFGDHVFKSGSPVLGGHITLDSTPIYLKLKPQYGGADIDLDNFSENIILNFTDTEFYKKRAKVIQTYDTPNIPTLIVKYLRGNHFNASEVIQTPTETYAAISDAEDYTGQASVAHIDYGIFYVNGYFVQVQPSTIVLDPYGITPSYRVGLEIDEQIIDESADTALLDPAQQSFNYQAPGAHRYKFSLVLSKRSLTSVDDTRFFELMRVENGVITKRVDYPIYSEIDRTLARRAADQSGDYVVTPFGIKLTANSADTSGTTAIVELGAGKAYVNGYEYISVGPQKLNLDKARTKANIADYDLSLEYGNYLYANNFISGSSGMFDTTQLPLIDLHCVPRANVDIGSSGVNYDKTFMGTARMVNFDHTEAAEYVAYLTDVNINAKTITLADATGTANTIKLPTGFSALNNAYANVIVRVVGGTHGSLIAGTEREIIAYDGSTRIASLDKNLPTNDLASGDIISFVYQSEDIESLVQPNSSNTALLNAMDISTSSRFGDNNYAKLFDTNIKSLIFPLPEFAVANTPFTNTDFYHKIARNNEGVTSGNITINLNTGESFYYGTNGEYLSDTQAKNHFIVVVTALSGGTSPYYTVGEPINFNQDYGGVTPRIYRTSEDSFQIQFGSGSNVQSCSYICSVKSSTTPNELVNVRTKVAYPAEEFDSLRSTDTITNANAIVGTRSIDTANGIVWFTNYSSMNKTADGYDNLYIPDVHSLVKVYESGDQNTNVNPGNAIDITSRYYLDSGQNIAYYDHSKLKLRPGAMPPKGKIAAIVRYYKHDESKNGYFNAYSYPASHYENNKIPVFKSSDGKEYNLRDCVDFRPAKAFASSSGFVGMINPIDNMEMSYQHYLPRIDKVILTQEDGLKVLQGIPSKFPAPPTINTKKSMELYTLSVPAYTSSLKDIKITESKNKRYTMKDIGVLEQRIENLEYYTALSLSEKTAKDKNLLYSDGTQKEKYGLLVDNFTDFSKADYNADDFLACVDQGILAPYVKLNNINMGLNYYDQDVVRVNDKTISMLYSEEAACKQLSATSTVNPQAFVFGMFNGTLKLIPECDEWFSDKFQSEYLGELFAKPGATDVTLVTAAQAAVAESRPPVSGFTPYTIIGYEKQSTTTQTNWKTSVANQIMSQK